MPYWAWAGALALLGLGNVLIWHGSWVLWLVVAALGAAFVWQPLRRHTLSFVVFKLIKKILPKISETEKTALEAGVTWVEKDLFSGMPRFDKIMQENYPRLSAQEEAFLEGPVNELCKMCNDWQVYKAGELPQEVMQFLKDKGFFGLCVPKAYGGLGFSHFAHSEVIKKLASRSMGLCITVMVPNSLGPAELLLHYGTDAQKNKWLPDLASGAKVPCFALTEPTAGSDAGAIKSEGVLFKNDQGRVCVRLNWTKRWITLAAISDLLGVAFRLKDPEGLLGRGEDVGITCALVDSKTPGVVLGRRHDPLGVPFYNCPLEGRDVCVDAETSIIGGLEGAGRGWGMLMESLGAGRGISLPSQSAGAAALGVRVVSAHAFNRRQFGLPIGHFEGVGEALARATSGAYLLEALRRFTAGALDKGIKPPVVTAIAKYFSTEEGRRVFSDIMDVLGGQGISMGPRNLVAMPYKAMPIGVTVEGANIMTRTFMIFGQGALRAHPWTYEEIKACAKGDLKAFDQAFWGHVQHVLRNAMRFKFHFITRGHFAPKGYGGVAGRYFQKLMWVSSLFAIAADKAMVLYGGDLKKRGLLCGRFADLLGAMYMALGVLRRFEFDGKPQSQEQVFKYTMDELFWRMQQAIEGLMANFLPKHLFFLKPFAVVWAALCRLNPVGRAPSDVDRRSLAHAVMQGGELRDSVTMGIYRPVYAQDKNEPLALFDEAMRLSVQSWSVEVQVKKLARKHRLGKELSLLEMAQKALDDKHITAEEMELLKRAHALRMEAIKVDDF